MPEVGEKVRHLHGDTRKSSADGTSYAWRLAFAEVAEVVEVDEDGDFRLKNPSGQESDFIHRQHFGYVGRAADAFGQHKILSVRFDDAYTVHQITPYSEIYGLHPREFVFDKHGSLLPATRFNSLGNNEDEEDSDSDEFEGEWEEEYWL